MAKNELPELDYELQLQALWYIVRKNNNGLLELILRTKANYYTFVICHLAKISDFFNAIMKIFKNFDVKK